LHISDYRSLTFWQKWQTLMMNMIEKDATNSGAREQNPIPGNAERIVDAMIGLIGTYIHKYIHIHIHIRVHTRTYIAIHT